MARTNTVQATHLERVINMNIFDTNKNPQQKLDEAFDREWKFLEQAGKVTNFPSLQDEGDTDCLCGLPLDNAGPDCYSHMTKGY